MNRRKRIKTFRYSTIYINIISLILSVIIFLNINLFLSNFNLIIPQKNLESGTEIKKENPETKDNELITKEWSLDIPSIGLLNAPIAEGTTEEVLNKYIGHFRETENNKRNIGLVAHNRGYENNYFENLKKLKKGDTIIYHKDGQRVLYEVTIITIIKDTDWSYLEDTEDNRITLITCVENQSEYRRCIQAIEREETNIE